MYIPSILILLILSIPAASNELRVKNMYELFPFPPLDVKSTVYISNEAIPRYPRHFIGPSQWLDIKHHVFSGRTPTGTLTLLFAGSGTGTSTILLCNQLRQHNIKFTAVHFDLSSASVAIAKKRAIETGHTNIKFIQGSLLNEKDMLRVKNDGPFDYIDCVGVLMATVNASKALHNLKTVLSSRGGIGIMVYATFGRAPIYQIRRTMQLLTQGNRNVTRKDQLLMLRKLLKDEGNHWSRVSNLGIHADDYDDVTLVDTYLHPVDRSYTIPETFELIHDAGLVFRSFTCPLLYDASTIPNMNSNVLSANEIHGWSGELNDVERYELAENFDGTLERHEFYVVHNNTQRRIQSIVDSPDMELVLRIPVLYFKQTILSTLRTIGRLVVPATEVGHRERVIQIPEHINHRNLHRVAQQIIGTRTTSGSILQTLREKSTWSGKNDAKRLLCKEYKAQFLALEWLGVAMVHCGYAVVHVKETSDDLMESWEHSEHFRDC
jgi:SAM-dependent methyltransferase